MKKIFLVTNSSWNIFNFRSELIEKIIKEKFKLIISCPIDEYTKKLDQKKFKFIPITYRRKSMSIFENIKIIFFYLYKINFEKPNILMLYTIKPNIFVSISTLLYFKKIKIYNFITGIGSLYFESGLKKKIILFLYKIAFLRSEKVIFQNIDDQNYFIFKKIINKNKCIIIPGSGINTNKFKFLPYTYNKNKDFNFLCVARLIQDKGIEEYIGAAELLIKEYPFAKFTLVGSIDHDYLNQLSYETLEKMKLFINHVDFTNDVIKYINQCDCFVLPSYREGTSRSLLEAASIGKPIVTTNVPGCNNIVFDNFNGYLCDPRSAISLYKNLKKMINTDFRKREKMAINSRKHIETQFDVKMINKKILEMIGI